MSVDPLAGSTDNPQSLDRCVYVLNDPVNLVDPLGLSHNCGHPPPPAPPGCIDFCVCAGGSWNCERVCANNPFEDCTIDGIACDFFYPGGGVHGTPLGAELTEAQRRRIEELLERLNELRERLGDLFRSNRQPHESFKDCVFANANEATFGHHKKLLGAAGATTAAALVANINVGGFPLPGFLGLVGASILSNRFGVPGLTALKVAGAAIETPILWAARAAPYVLAVEAGILLGSAVKCR